MRREAQGGAPLADLDQGAITSFPVEGYVVTRQWAAKYPRTLAAFYTALEEGQQIADTSRTAVESAMIDMPAPFGVSADAIQGRWSVAALNLTTSSAGTRPRSFTSMPCALAHSRTSVEFRPLAEALRPLRADRRAPPLTRRPALK
jgi:hypothetical protein